MSKKLRTFDEKDRKIMMILQNNPKETLNSLSRQVGLSIDSVNKRLKKLTELGILNFKVMINPAAIGYSLVIDTKIKLKNADENIYKQLISYLNQHPQVIELFQVSGSWDISFISIAKDMKHVTDFSNQLKFNFAGYIADLHSVVNIHQFKSEYYDLNAL